MLLLPSRTPTIMAVGDSVLSFLDSSSSFMSLGLSWDDQVLEWGCKLVFGGNG